MKATIITTTSRRIAVQGEYKDICERVREWHGGYMFSGKTYNYIDVIEYSNAFANYNDFLSIDFRTQNTVNARIFIDTITDISQITI